jgi:hypothetical protein
MNKPGVTKQMPSANAMGSLDMAKGGKAKPKAKAKMAVAMMKDRIGRALAARGAEAPMPPVRPAPMASAPPMPSAPPMGMAKGGGIERKGKTKGTMVKMAKGGSIDGCAIRGKTRATMVKKAMGGKMKGC